MIKTFLKDGDLKKKKKMESFARKPVSIKKN